MKISIIIPTFNAENNIETLLAGIALQNLTDFEVIVIDSSSTDKTLQIAQTYGAKTISVPRNKFDHGGTRTNALQEAKGDIAVLFSQDVKLYDSDSIKNLTNVFDNQDTALAYGRQVPALNATVFAKHLRIYNYC
jgi:rhamnosyltransferase